MNLKAHLNNQHQKMTKKHKRRGSVMVAVTVVTLMAALVSASLLFRMQAEISSVAAISQGDQAYTTAMSGIHLAIALLTTPPIDEESSATTPESADATEDENTEEVVLKTIAPRSFWYDTEELFKNRFVYDDGANRWYFTIWARNWQDAESVRFGLTDEAGKINLNTADEEVLAAMPNMTTELVDALLDYRDKDDETRPEGAEQDYYDQILPVPYMIKNGPIGTLEELLMVKGFNATLIYGEDANRNTLLEPNEDDGDEKFPPDDSDGLLNGGFHELVTTSALDLAVNSAGEPQININGNTGKLKTQLETTEIDESTINFIVSYRNDGNSFKHPSQLLDMSYTTKPKGGRGGGGGGQNIKSNVTASDLPLILDKLTVSGANTPVPGLVNVNTASPTVLALLPDIDESIAESIIQTRGTLEDEDLKTTAWLLTEGILDEEQYKTTAPRLTSRGFQYHIRVVGFGVPNGRYRVLEAIIDLSGVTPRISYLRDITQLGVPFPLIVEEDSEGGTQ